MAERIHIKSPGEVAKMQKAGAVTAEILMEIGAEVQVGRTTREIDDIAREILKAQGRQFLLPVPRVSRPALHFH